jgi:excisionase family DNA binding protein
MIEMNGINYLTYDETAERLKLEYSYLKKLVHTKSIPTVRVGRRKYIEEDYVKDMEGRAVLKLIHRWAGR